MNGECNGHFFSHMIKVNGDLWFQGTKQHHKNHMEESHKRMKVRQLHSDFNFLLIFIYFLYLQTNSTYLKFPQNALIRPEVKNKLPLLCCRYHTNKAALQAHCLAVTSVCQQTVYALFLFVFPPVFSFFWELKMGNLDRHTHNVGTFVCN